MKFTAAKQELMKSLNIVLKAVPSKTTMSILYSILIDATVDTIRFTGNDMELGIETVVEGQIEERGLICLDAKLLSEIVRKLPDEDVTIQTDKDYQTTITCGNSVFRITGRDGTEFSPLPSIDKKDPVILSQFQLRELIRQTIFSIAPKIAKLVDQGLFVSRPQRIPAGDAGHVEPDDEMRVDQSFGRIVDHLDFQSVVALHLAQSFIFVRQEVRFPPADAEIEGEFHIVIVSPNLHELYTPVP